MPTIDAEVDPGTTDRTYALAGPSQRQPAGSGARSCQLRGGRRGAVVPVLQCHTKQHGGCGQPGLSRTVGSS